MSLRQKQLINTFAEMHARYPTAHPTAHIPECPPSPRGREREEERERERDPESEREREGGGEREPQRERERERKREREGEREPLTPTPEASEARADGANGRNPHLESVTSSAGTPLCPYQSL
jgi:hypothetical protein